jgi:hypothetical protein
MLGTLFLASNTVQAQTEVLVKKTDWADYIDIKYSILSDSIINTIAASSDKNVVFVFERNGV